MTGNTNAMSVLTNNHTKLSKQNPNIATAKINRASNIEIKNNHNDNVSVISQALENVRSQAAIGAGNIKFSPRTTKAYSKLQKSPLLRGEIEVTTKGNAGLEKIYETKANAETNIFEKMTQQEAHKDGKRLFVGIGNVSDPHNMHEFDA